METKNDGIWWSYKSGFDGSAVGLDELQMRSVRQQIETELDKLDKLPRELLSDEELDFISKLCVR
jgi:hypothetical protein